jgi:hypothetical protein
MTKDEMSILRQGLEPEGINVWCERCYAGPEQLGRIIGHSEDKDRLLAQGFLRSKGGWITQFETSEAGYIALCAAA